MLELGLISLFVSIASILWLLGRPWLSVSLARDKPIWWPWLVFLSPVCNKFLSWRMRQNFIRLQIKSGLPNYWLAELWLSHKLLCSIASALLFLIIAAYIELAAKLIILIFIGGAITGYMLPDARLIKQAKQRQRKMLTELPFMLDLLTLCVESGLSLAMAIQKVAKHSPNGPLRASLRDAMALERTGMDRSSWLQNWAQNSELEGLQNLVLALNQADKTGMNLGPVLRSQAEQQRSARFIRAEAMALQAPVKMLFPMVLCIFPCTFLIIGFPILIKLFEFNF